MSHLQAQQHGIPLVLGSGGCESLSFAEGQTELCPRAAPPLVKRQGKGLSSGLRESIVLQFNSMHRDTYEAGACLSRKEEGRRYCKEKSICWSKY